VFNSTGDAGDPQDGFGNHGTEPARSTKSDNDDDRMQKKSENVAHAEDGIRLRKLKNSGRLRNSPPTGKLCEKAVLVLRLERSRRKVI
jgi:hypothetical protein